MFALSVDLGNLPIDHNESGPVRVLRGPRTEPELWVLMRLNLERSVMQHIPRLAREMKWDEDRALGKLARVYWVTQEAEAYEELPGRMVTLCALIFDSDQEAENFFTAMIAAQLAVLLDDKRIRIRGNLDHIRRLQTYRSRAQSGGIAKSKKSNDFVASKQAASKHQAATPLSPSVPSFTPLLLTPKYEEEDLNTISETVSEPLTLSSELPLKRKPKKAPDQRSVAINRRYRELFKMHTGNDPIMAASQNALLSRFAKTFTDEAPAMLEEFFSGRNAFYKLRAYSAQTLWSSAEALRIVIRDSKPAQRAIKSTDEQHREMLARIARDEAGL